MLFAILERSLTVGFLLSGESLATDRGEMPGSMLSASLAALVPTFRVGVTGVCGIAGTSDFSLRGRRFWATLVGLIVSVGEGSGVIKFAGGVTGRSDMSSLGIGDGVFEVPGLGVSDGKRARSGVSLDRLMEGVGDS